jgi:hypothetical protein
MPVGIGTGIRDVGQPGAPSDDRPVTAVVARAGFHPGALWLAASAPVVATLLLLARLAA